MSPILTWEGTGEVPNFCPQGCGGITEDVYGGPCQACWAEVDREATSGVSGSFAVRTCHASGSPVAVSTAQWTL